MFVRLHIVSKIYYLITDCKCSNRNCLIINELRDLRQFLARVFNFRGYSASVADVTGSENIA